MSDTLGLLALSTRCLCAGVIARSIELLWNWRELPDGRLLGWPSDEVARPARVGLLQWSMRHPQSLCVLAFRIGAALACVMLPVTARAQPPLLASLALTQAYYNYRFDTVRHSADTMFLIGLAAAFVGSLDRGDEALHAAALTFLGAQALLAYYLAGRDKLANLSWRNGQRLVEILSDSANRFEPLGTLVARHRGLAAAMSWGVILLEISFPLSVVLPGALFWSAIGAGLAFHLVIAATMGLHGFFWSFGAAYPGIYFIHQWLAGYLRSG